MAKKKKSESVVASINPVQFLEENPELKAALNSVTKDFSAQVRRIIEKAGIQAHIKVSFGFTKEQPAKQENGA